MGARRKRIGRGIYRDKYGVSAIVKVGTGDEARQREKRYPFDTPLKDIKAWQESMRAELRTALRRPAALARGTLEADAKVYLAQVKHLTSYKSRVGIVRHERPRQAAVCGGLAEGRPAVSGAAFRGARTGERGIDLADVASMLGHKDVATTRRHYQGILASRLKGASDTLAGRFHGWETPEAEQGSLDTTEPVAGVH